MTKKRKLLIIVATLVVAFVGIIALARTTSLALAKPEVITASEFGHRHTHRINGDFIMILRCYLDSYAAGKFITYQYSAEIENTNPERRVLILFDGPSGAEYQVAYEIGVEKEKIEKRIIVRMN